VLVLSQYVEQTHASELLRRRKRDRLPAQGPGGPGRRVPRRAGPGGDPASTRTLVVTERAVHKHIGNVFDKLGLPPNDSGHRRVLAVLAYLNNS
jgi:hypothetical protein